MASLKFRDRALLAVAAGAVAATVPAPQADAGLTKAAQGMPSLVPSLPAHVSNSEQYIGYQVGYTFKDNETSISVDVPAVLQSLKPNASVNYILNGLMNDGYWYQIGVTQANGMIGYVDGKPTKVTGLHVISEVFNPSGVPVFPSSGGAWISVDSTLEIRSGNVIRLSMGVSGHKVKMEAQNLSNGRSTEFNGNDPNASYFVGGISPKGGNNTFTGVMTEVHGLLGQQTGYSVPTKFVLGNYAPAFMWVLEAASSQTLGAVTSEVGGVVLDVTTKNRPLSVAYQTILESSSGNAVTTNPLGAAKRP